MEPTGAERWWNRWTVTAEWAGRKAVLAVLGLVLCVSGCLPVGVAERAQGPSAGAERPAEGLPLRAEAQDAWPTPLPSELDRAEPTRVLVPRLGISAPLVVLGVQDDGALAVPPLDHANVAGWYGEGPTPGERGAAVIAGHLDTRTGPAVFATLEKLRAGDVVGVVRTDGTVAVFTVQRLERTPKTSFPADEIYGPSDERELTLITCGGAFDQDKRSYNDNVIVHATYRAAYRAADLR